SEKFHFQMALLCVRVRSESLKRVARSRLVFVGTFSSTFGFPSSRTPLTCQRPEVLSAAKAIGTSMAVASFLLTSSVDLALELDYDMTPNGRSPFDVLAALA